MGHPPTNTMKSMGLLGGRPKDRVHSYLRFNIETFGSHLGRWDKLGGCAVGDNARSNLFIPFLTLLVFRSITRSVS